MVKIGSRELTGEDHLVIREEEIIHRSRPENAVVVRRIRDGDVFGRVVELAAAAARLRLGHVPDTTTLVEDLGAFNAETGEYSDMMEMGVIVPTKVERSALQNAASVAGLLLTTDAVVSEIPEKKEAPAGAGMDDMY